MNPLLPVALATALALTALTATAQAAPQADAAATAPAPPRSANEAAGLPDLDTLNRPVARDSASVDLNAPRTPSFHERSGSGTEITEYRDRGKPVEIEVHSNFGTHYKMTAPTDTSPRIPTGGQPSTRLPSINLTY